MAAALAGVLIVFGIARVLTTGMPSEARLWFDLVLGALSFAALFGASLPALLRHRRRVLAQRARGTEVERFLESLRS